MVVGSTEIMKHHEMVTAVIVLLMLAYLLYKHQATTHTDNVTTPGHMQALLRAGLVASAACAVLYYAQSMGSKPRPAFSVTVNPLAAKM